MSTMDMVLLATTGIATVVGLLAGAFVPARGFTVIRGVVVAGLILFLFNNTLAVVVARAGSDISLQSTRMLIFWMAFVGALMCLFGLCSRVAGLFRKGLRRTAGLIALLSALVVPILLAVGGINRMLR